MTNANPLELAMLDMINNERAEAGLEELRLLTLLNSAAENHSSWMLGTNMFSHQGVDGTSPSDRMEMAGYDFQGESLALENIGWQSARGAEGYEDDVAQVHEGLMASPGHRANILNPEAEDLGIGIEVGTFTGSGGDYEAVMVTQVFGATDTDLSAWVDPGTSEVDEESLAEDDPGDIEDDLINDDEVVDEPQDGSDADDQIENEIDDQDNEEPISDNDSEDDCDDTNNDTPDDVAADDELDMEQPEPNTAPPLPCDLADFRVDLREAFEFRQEGDQLIWETSEERLAEVFMNAFEDWSSGAIDMVDDGTEPTGIEELLTCEASDADLKWANSDEEPTEDWMFDTCA